MTAKLEPKPGFDWNKVVWSKADVPPGALCSYCFSAIGEDDTPLRLWSPAGDAAQFCDHCMERWWGMTVFKEDGDG